MGLEQIVPAIALIAVLVLVLPNFLKNNSEKKQLLKNLFIWFVVIIVVILISFLVLK